MGERHSLVPSNGPPSVAALLVWPFLVWPFLVWPFLVCNEQWRGRRNGCAGRDGSVRVEEAVGSILADREELGDLRVAQRLARKVGEQVLFRDVGDILRLRVLGQEVVERLVLARANLGRDRLPPLLGIVEDRINVEDETAEIMDAMADNLAHPVLGVHDLSHSAPSIRAALSIAARLRGGQ